MSRIIKIGLLSVALVVCLSCNSRVENIDPSDQLSEQEQIDKAANEGMISFDLATGILTGEAKVDDQVVAELRTLLGSRARPVRRYAVSCFPRVHIYRPTLVEQLLVERLRNEKDPELYVYCYWTMLKIVDELSPEIKELHASRMKEEKIAQAYAAKAQAIEVQEQRMKDRREKEE